MLLQPGQVHLNSSGYKDRTVMRSPFLITLRIFGNISAADGTLITRRNNMKKVGYFFHFAGCGLDDRFRVMILCRCRRRSGVIDDVRLAAEKSGASLLTIMFFCPENVLVMLENSTNEKRVLCFRGLNLEGGLSSFRIFISNLHFESSFRIFISNLHFESFADLFQPFPSFGCHEVAGEESQAVSRVSPWLPPVD